MKSLPMSRCGSVMRNEPPGRRRLRTREKRIEIYPFINDVGADDDVKPLRDLSGSPVHAAERDAGEFFRAKVHRRIEAGELEGIVLVIRHQHPGARLRRRNPRETESASQLEKCPPPEPRSPPQLSGKDGR